MDLTLTGQRIQPHCNCTLALPNSHFLNNADSEFIRLMSGQLYGTYKRYIPILVLRLLTGEPS